MKKCLRLWYRTTPFYAYVMRIALSQLGLILALTTIADAHLSNGQSVLDRPVSVQFVKTPLREILSSIEKKTQAKFVYSSLVISNVNQVSLTANGESLSSVLKRLLTPLSISYEVFNERIILSKNVTQPTVPRTGEAALTGNTVMEGIPVRGRVKASRRGRRTTGCERSGER